jgi:hypothetical protein
MLTKEELLGLVKDEITKGLGDQGKEIVKAVEGVLGKDLKGLVGVPAQLPGDQFAANQAVKDFYSTQARSTSPIPVNMKAWGYGLKAGERLESRYAVNIHTKAGEVITSLFPSERTYLPFAEFPQRRFRLRDLIPVAGLGTPQIEYARITGYSNLAAGVAELATKPQSQIFTQVVLDAVKLIATFLPVTRQSVADVPGLAGYVNQVLVYFMQLKEDNEVLSGAGGVDMTGILNVPGVQSRALGADTRIDAIRKAITDLQIAFTDAGFQPNGIVMHPTDWQNMELQKDSTGKYLLIPFVETPAEGGPQPPRLWRLPVVPTPAIPAGTALVGEFDIGATIWTYEDVTLRITDSHAVFFVKNLLVVLAEFRELLAVYFPRSFEVISGL